MTFNYAKVFDELKSQFPGCKMNYDSCTSNGHTFLVDKRAHYFVIRIRIHEPTFNEDMICLSVVSKSLLRGNTGEVVALLKRSFEEAFNDGIQKRLTGGEYLKATLVCT